MVGLSCRVSGAIWRGLLHAGSAHLALGVQEKRECSKQNYASSSSSSIALPCQEGAGLWPSALGIFLHHLCHGAHASESRARSSLRKPLHQTSATSVRRPGQMLSVLVLLRTALAPPRLTTHLVMLCHCPESHHEAGGRLSAQALLEPLAVRCMALGWRKKGTESS